MDILSKPSENRISHRFQALAAAGRPALITFVMAGDPDEATSLRILENLSSVGADIIEIGMPFSDPMADGVSVQTAGQRALRAGMTLRKTLSLVKALRDRDATTPLILMGYYNPIYVFGADRFIDEAKAAGVDGLIVVDLPHEQDDELCLPAVRAGIHFIRLVPPTALGDRLPRVLSNTSGFIYYVSITGVTGGAAPDIGSVSGAVQRLKEHTRLPVVVGFGVKDAQSAATMGRLADGVVVGSAIVDALKDSLGPDGQATERTVPVVLSLVAELAKGVQLAVRDV